MPDQSVEHTIPGDYQLKALHHGRSLQRAWHRARLDLLAGLLPPPDSGYTLDAACGAGIVTWRFPRSPIVSTDMRLNACVAVRAHAPDAIVVAAMVDRLPFSSGTFAQVYFLEALEHLNAADGLAALQELRRVSKPGARCLLTTPNYRSHWRAIEKLIDWSGLTPPMEAAQHVSRYHRTSLRRAAESAGWRVLRLGSFNLLAPVGGLISRRAGSILTRVEATVAHGAGPLLFAVCQRDR